MSLSGNIKRLRLERNLTQEQLATKLGVSAQAVSKWETSDTYPDGTLLVPLAGVLSVSLDELFGNDSVSMADISVRIMKLLKYTKPEERFDLARDIAWQIERGLFNCDMELEKYDPRELEELTRSSYILNDFGFTVVSNGKEPFFSIFPEPKEGFGDFLNGRERLQNIFAALSHEHTMNALIYLYGKTKDFVFESELLAKDCEIPDEALGAVLADLIALRTLSKQELTINGEVRTLYHSRPNHKLLALLLMAHENCYEGGHATTERRRNAPLLKDKNTFGSTK